MNQEIEMIKRSLKRLKDPEYIESLKKQMENVPTPHLSLFDDQCEWRNPDPE